MAFEQELREYLEGLERSSPSEAPLARCVDEQELHKHFLRRMRELEDEGSLDVVQALFHRWQPQVEPLARYVESLPSQLAPTDTTGALTFACLVFDAIAVPRFPGLSSVDKIELQRVAFNFGQRRSLVKDYALENNLVRRHAERVVLTELGRVFLQLRGKGSIRWLVTVEVEQNSGASDPWHASRELVEAASSESGVVEPRWGEFYWVRPSLDRLTRLRLVSFIAREMRFAVPQAMLDVARDVLTFGPWHIAIRALLEDESAFLLPSTTVSVSESTIEQTKLVVHEVRNALIPVRHDIDKLQSVVSDPAHRERVESARHGVVRVLDFVESMVQMSELITEPLVRCELAGVIDEALRIDSAHRVQHARAADALHVMAPRTRLAGAISNVIGNALQATTEGQPVRVSAVRVAGHVRITVDDGGPGVPIEHRRQIFHEGVTMRRDGSGSGYGLAFAQRVVESTLHGRIWCEDSDLGGARFVIELPEPSEPDKS